jgi:rhodanese-related sulfurtransferase
MSAGRAQSLGYSRVFVMNEGIEGWAELGLPVIRPAKEGL